MRQYDKAFEQFTKAIELEAIGAKNLSKRESAAKAKAAAENAVRSDNR